MIVVSDTSPLRALEHLGLASLLQQLFHEVVIPPAVESELTFPPQRYAPISAAAFPGLRVQSPTNATLVGQIGQTLDLGESEAIALAIELQADIVLRDEALGRSEAARRGLTVTGMIGILLRGKRAGLLTALAPLLDELRHGLGFYLSDKLVRETLNLAGE